jgi:hypothetical protein
VHDFCKRLPFNSWRSRRIHWLLFSKWLWFMRSANLRSLGVCMYMCMQEVSVLLQCKRKHFSAQNSWSARPWRESRFLALKSGICYMCTKSKVHYSFLLSQLNAFCQMKDEPLGKWLYELLRASTFNLNLILLKSGRVCWLSYIKWDWSVVFINL